MGLSGASNTTTVFSESVVVSSLSTPCVEGSKWHGDKFKSNAALNEVLLPTSVQGDEACAINVANVEESSGPMLRKKTWKRLARAKGNSSNGDLVGPKRGVALYERGNDDPEKKRSKIFHGSLISVSSDSVNNP
jgi:hypothetical protein